MQRRTLLLFALFVVTAWFYASVADDSSQVAASPQHEQVQLRDEMEKVLSGSRDGPAESDQG